MRKYIVCFIILLQLTFLLRPWDNRLWHARFPSLSHDTVGAVGHASADSLCPLCHCLCGHSLPHLRQQSIPSIPLNFGLPAFSFRLVCKYLSEALAPGLTTKLSTGMQDLESKAHTGPLATVQIFLRFAIFLGCCLGGSKRTPLSRRYRCLYLITYPWLLFSTILNSREAFFYWGEMVFPPQTISNLWLIQAFLMFGSFKASQCLANRKFLNQSVINILDQISLCSGGLSCASQGV